MLFNFIPKEVRNWKWRMTRRVSPSKQYFRNPGKWAFPPWILCVMLTFFNNYLASYEYFLCIEKNYKWILLDWHKGSLRSIRKMGPTWKQGWILNGNVSFCKCSVFPCRIIFYFTFYHDLSSFSFPTFPTGMTRAWHVCAPPLPALPLPPEKD